MRDYGTARWEGGDPACDHQAPTYQGKTNQRANRTFTANRPYKEVCRKCGARRIDAQLGLEATPEDYIAALVTVFREVRRVLRDNGTLWLNLGDSYATSPPGNKPGTMKSCSGLPNSSENLERRCDEQRRQKGYGNCKPKDLIGIPWRCAFALQSDGWYLRSAICWYKTNPMPESVTDRPTSAYEMVFLLTKQQRYYYDQKAIRERGVSDGCGGDQRDTRLTHGVGGGNTGLNAAKQRLRDEYQQNGFVTRNCHNVWTINTRAFKGAHFATMPPMLAERCIKAGSKMGDTVLDPFAGAGTTGLVAQQLGRDAVLIELNPDYVALAERRLTIVI